jgi:hypothetical protein
MQSPTDLFEDEREVALEDGAAIIERRDLGRIRIVTGQLAACDPFVFARDVAPFAQTVSPGEYPVDASVFVIQPSGDKRVAFARVRISEKPPVRWVNASPKGKTLADLVPGEEFGYGVDAGTGCFADVATLRAFDECGEDASDELMAAMDRTYENTWSWADVTCGDSGENIIAFSSGYGDGFYRSFWGLAEDGMPVCLVTDFGLCEVTWNDP